MRLTDPAAIRALLESDRSWSAYALGDLAPGFFERSEWHCHPGPVPALLLLYRAFETPVLFTLGPVDLLANLLAGLAAERSLYLSIRPEVLPLIQARYRVEPPAGVPMWRMVLTPSRFDPAPFGEVERLAPSDLPALEALFADGQPTGEAPDFFEPGMVAQGFYYGVRDGAGALMAAAGTHLVAPELGVAAIGNVYTRRDCRGRGLARRVTSAVTAALLAHDPPLRTIALNVNQRNTAALRVYEGLGYERYCPFLEGLALMDEG